MNQRVLILAAVVLAALATVSVYMYVQGLEDDKLGGLATVIVPTTDIPAGTAMEDVVAQGALATKDIPVDAVVTGAVNDVSQLRGTTASSAILAGEQIPIARITGQLPGGSLGIPEGFQAVSINLTEAQSVSGAITAGDRVVIYGSFTGGPNPSTVVLIPDAQVLEITPPPEGGNAVATLAVSAEDAQRLVFTAGNGQPWLSLLPPDGEGTTRPPMTLGKVLRS